MKLFAATILLTFNALNLISSLSNLHGVNPKYLSKYSNSFLTCDGRNIKKEEINDDYCDCINGEDEPGTSACLNSKFYCLNKNHIPIYISSSKVNDGVCDEECCDGSDEYNGFVTCPNTCKQAAVEYNRDKKKELEMKQVAMKTKLEYVNFHKTEKKRRELELKKLQSQIADSVALVEKYTKAKEEAQIYEERVEKLRNSTMAKKQQKECPTNLKAIRNDFKNLRNKLIKANEKINFLFEVVEPLNKKTLSEKSVEEEEFEEPVLSENCLHDPVLMEMKTNIEQLRYDNSEEVVVPAEPLEEEGDDVVYSIEELEKFFDPCQDNHSSGFECLKSGLNKIKLNLVGFYSWKGWNKLFYKTPLNLINSFLYKSSITKTGDEVVDDLESRFGEYKDLSEAEKNLELAENEKRDLESKIEKLETISGIDFGPLGIFEKLYEQCINLDTPEYTYEVCLFGRSTQKSKKGHGDTSIGSFKRWGKRGDDKVDYNYMMFENGVSCWNGPERSLEVTFECGQENKALSVAEPSKCEYSIKILTPAVCEDDNINNRDEL
ncbi:hypothetical protein HDU92_003344 [Lobulomyces angularis]|nr:hypothetical protein HDU92_003344 [Lobulomyces angularis]